MIRIECPYCKGKVKLNMEKIKSALKDNAMYYVFALALGLSSLGWLGLIRIALSGSKFANILLQIKIHLMFKKSASYFKCSNCKKDTPIEHVFNQLLADGEFYEIWVEHRVYKNHQKGMKIHTQFSVEYLQEVNCRAIVYFTYHSGQSVQDSNGLDWTLVREFTPSSDNSIYNDFVFFLPYEKIPLPEGQYDLKFHIRLYINSVDKHFIKSEEYFFQVIPS
jgi:DNA-directed RNA polymerase subunit RPC12/RpoP